ncbi:MAG: outer membrane beta-barrel protein [Deltaproteobacteria bacterium]|nr:outer membrane beta-barrel protein [Nannocystaceae bacterium]
MDAATLESSEPIARPPGPEFAAQGPPAVAASMRPPDLVPEPVPTLTVPSSAPQPAPTAGSVPAAPLAAPKWFERITVGVLADAYANVNYNFPQPQSGRNFGRTMETTNGFAVSWFGGDVAIDSEYAGGLVSLRFGPGAANYAGPDNGSFLQNVKQGYAFWKPKVAKKKLSIEFGKFDSPFGVEVGDSFMNMNYTRATLYTLGQPYFHTGFRVKVTVTPRIALNLLAVNGWNNSVDNNKGKSFGAQLALTPHPKFGVFLGYLGGPENGETMSVTCAPGAAFDPRRGTCPASAGAAGESVSVGVHHENRVIRHLADLVATAAPTEKLTLALNGDLIYDRVITNPVTGATARALWAGGILSARYAFTQRWAVAARAEYLQDFDGVLTFTARNTAIGTGTATVEFAPTPYLILRLENRADHSTHALYARGPTGMGRTMITTTLGVVVKSF